MFNNVDEKFYLIIMSHCEMLNSSLNSEVGLVAFKFDPTFGPTVLLNHSFLDENLITVLGIKGVSTLMAGINYSFLNTRRFRGIFQISEELFAYCYDLLIFDDKSDIENPIPIIFFIVFTKSLMPMIGSNLLVIEEHLTSYTSGLFLISQITPEFGLNVLSSLKNALI